jgi:hypothetical protein
MNKVKKKGSDCCTLGTQHSFSLHESESRCEPHPHVEGGSAYIVHLKVQQTFLKKKMFKYDCSKWPNSWHALLDLVGAIPDKS